MKDRKTFKTNENKVQEQEKRKNIQSLKKRFYISSLCFLLLSITFLLMPLGVNGPENNDPNVMTIILGLSFWLTLFAGIITQLMLFRKFKQLPSKCKNHYGLGLIHFFQNKKAAVADLCCMVSLVLFIVFMLIDGTMYIGYVLLSIAVFSFYMHCALNGKIYNTLFEKQNKKPETKEEGE